MLRSKRDSFNVSYRYIRYVPTSIVWDCQRYMYIYTIINPVFTTLQKITSSIRF